MTDPKESDELRQLLSERHRLTQLLKFYDATAPARRILVVGVLVIFAVWLVFAIWNGMIGISHLLWGVPLCLLVGFLLTRKIWYGEKFVYVFGFPTGGHDPDDLRRRLAECDAKIAELKTRSSG
jgi:hypothetical protein